jgi:hypothetical protein
MSRISEALELLVAGRLGFAIDETMSGVHEFEPDFGPPGERPLEFRVTWGAKDFLEWLNPRGKEFLRQDLWGTITVGGLCENAACDGTLALRYFDKKKIRYTLNFWVEDKPYRFVGEKVNIRAWNLPVSHTTCFGTITEVDTGRLVSRSVTYFHLKTIPQFAGSLRLAVAPEAA